MRQSLKGLIQKTIILEYKLPVSVAGLKIPRTHISTTDDHCLKQIGTNYDVAQLIYNGIVEYAYNDSEINLIQLNKLQIRALQSKLKYNPAAKQSVQLAYGFHGEVLLHLILEHFFQAEKAIARGYMYSALENSETKGYDSYLMVEKTDTIYMLFGEAKFYLSGYKDSLNAIFDNIDKALSDDYLNRNFIAMDNQYEHISPSSIIPGIINSWRDNPLINMADEARHHNMHLVYPMLVIFDNKSKEYDKLILEVVTHINTKCGQINPTLTIPYTLFFIFLPVDSSRNIKSQVLQWISQKQPLLP